MSHDAANHDAPRPYRLRLIDDDDVAKLPPPSWLVKDVIQARSLAVVYGAPGTGKSFIALDIAFSVATGKEWQGLPVKRGPVVYIQAEGQEGLSPRVKAWKIEHNVAGRAGVKFFDEAVSLVGYGVPLVAPGIGELIEMLKAERVAPVLIVFDTLAQCFIGGDESDAEDMGLAIAAINRLKRECETAVLLIHHTVKNARNKVESERGSGALRAAAETMLRLTRDGTGRLTLTNDKQKNGKPAATMTLRLRTVKVGDGEDSTSCMVERAAVQATTGEAASEPEPHQAERTEGNGRKEATKRDMLELVPAEGAKPAVWQVACAEAGVVRKSQFHTLKKELLAERRVALGPDGLYLRTDSAESGLEFGPAQLIAVAA